VDHIMAVSRGGSHLMRNLALVCGFCNLAKHDHTLDVFMSWLEWIKTSSYTPFNMTPEEVQDADYERKIRT